MIIKRLSPTEINNAYILMTYYQDEMQIPEDKWIQEDVIQGLKQYAISGETNCLVAMEGSRVIGIIMGGLKKEFYNSKMIAYIQLLYMLPQYRDEYTYKLMFDEYAKWFAPLGIKELVLSDIIDEGPRLEEISDILDFDSKTFKFYIKEIV